MNEEEHGQWQLCSLERQEYEAWLDSVNADGPDLDESYQQLVGANMAIKTSNSGGDFEKAPAGMHVARCFRIVDCGTHMDEKWQKSKRIGWIFFELPKSLMQADDKGHRKPFMVGKRYTLSHNEKAALRLDLESWYGKSFNTADLDNAGGFDLEKLMGRPAMLNVVHSDDGKYVNIKSINPLPEGLECPAQINPNFSFSIDEAKTDKINQFSEKMKAYSLEAKELKGEKIPAISQIDPDDGIPF